MASEAPQHLSPATRAWWATVTETFELQGHHVRLLSLAGAAFDRAEQAREALAERGTVYTDRFGQPRARPEVGIERDARIAFARLIRELDLDDEPAPESRPPRKALAMPRRLRTGKSRAWRFDHLELALGPDSLSAPSDDDMPALIEGMRRWYEPIDERRRRWRMRRRPPWTRSSRR